MGWRLSLWITAAGFAGVVFLLGVYGTGEEVLRAAIRLTARFGAFVFLAPFSASALNALFRTDWSKWLLRNRRYLGLGFAGVHFLHAALIIVLAVRYTESFFAGVATTTLVGGAVGYALLIAMVATSFDSTTAALGPRAWKALHKSGIYVLWGIFVFSYIGGVTLHPLYALLTALLLLAWIARIAAAVRRMSRRRLAPQDSP